MFENIAAIDIGTSAVKVVSVKTGFKDFQVRTFIIEELDHTMENRAEALHKAMTSILADENMKGVTFVGTLPMEYTLLRNLTFPFKEIDKITDAVPYEAEENIPFNIEDIIFDFQPMSSETDTEGKILLAATLKNNITSFLEPLSEMGISFSRLGMESNALFECYTYFNTMDDENVIQLHLGANKTIMNIIIKNRLLFTRLIPAGTGHIIDEIVEILGKTKAEADEILKKLSLDLISLDNNIQRENYKSLDINKKQLKSIYNAAMEISTQLTEEINLTIKAFFADRESLAFNRIIVSGGGSNLTGLGTILSQAFELPVVSLPFLESATDQNIQTLCPVAFGSLLSYLNTKSYSINFLKGEFGTAASQYVSKMYYLAAAFGVLTVFVLFLNIISSAIFSSTINKKYNEIIIQQYTRYFRAKPITDNPIAEANKILAKEKKELEGIEMLMSGEGSLMDLLKEITVDFPKDSDFSLKNMVINERIIRIDGSIGSSQAIDQFKEKLKETKKFDSVTMDIKSSQKGEVRFAMTIKMKLDDDKAKTKKAPVTND